jgi:hypothetical protein
MRVLPSALRKQLESAVLAGRRAAEAASRAALESLGVFADRRPDHLDVEQAALRNGLRAKWRQLGSDKELLVGECAYEQWHRLLFARFLAENDLLLHPQYRAPVTLEDCEDLAGELGEPDGWSVAARFAAEILPGIFRLEDPCVRLRLAPEGRHALEQVIAGLPAEVFAADDSLGWVYQFWQKDKKDEVNASERKIGGADLGPVTQLFTENYMVRFLLENSLGAWWASRHPDSPLVAGFDYLRFGDDGRPAAGSFDGWPEQVGEVTVMDPCCGSGHFLVEAFSMLWQMRAEEEGLDPVEAQDAVLRDNLFGLELDPRCVQIAMFAVALQAWKAGGKWRQLPVPNVACSGIPVKAPVDEWKKLAGIDQRLENALARLHILFREADTLGSLINPQRATAVTASNAVQRSLEDVDWHEVAPLVAQATDFEAADPATTVLGVDAAGVARAARFLSKKYVLITTNPPFLARWRQGEALQDLADNRYSIGRTDLATMCLLRCSQLAHPSGTVATVAPQNWMFQVSYEDLRREYLAGHEWNVVAQIGEHGFQNSAAAGAFVALFVITNRVPGEAHLLAGIDAVSGATPASKAHMIQTAPLMRLAQRDSLSVDQACVILAPLGTGKPLKHYCRATEGLSTGDGERFLRQLWEIAPAADWRPLQEAPEEGRPYGGLSLAIYWEGEDGELARSPAARIQGKEAWGQRGVLVGRVRNMRAGIHLGHLFEKSSVVLLPSDSALIAPLYYFCSDRAFHEAVRRIDSSLKVTISSLLKVSFDAEYWRGVAEAAGPLPEPSSDDPTQWLFEGRPENSTAPLHVAVARLLGYRWPEQAESDDLDPVADADGIACLPSVAGEPPAAERLQQVLVEAFGESWSPAKQKELLEQTGSKKKNLSDWLRDDFFKQHCALFANRPFVWHVWDGQRDGFSAVVNYRRLDRKALEKLTYTYLGQDWVERQRAAVRDETPGAEARLVAALGLQRRLEAILTGEAPHDIFVRWKNVHEQPVGWEPDLNDGVRLNIRPLVEAEVLRAPFNIHWKKDRGKNPDGSERHNDIHLSLAEKLEARTKAGRT